MHGMEAISFPHLSKLTGKEHYNAGRNIVTSEIKKKKTTGKRACFPLRRRNIGKIAKRM